MAPTIYDKTGAKRDWAWLLARYGAPDYLQSKHKDSPWFDLVEIRETTGVTDLFVQVNQADGTPWGGVMVVLTWPTLDGPADYLPDLTTGDPAIDQWSKRGVAQFTQGGGNTGFGLGKDSWIRGDPATGPYNVWIFHKSIGSAAFIRFGWLGGTDHEGPCRLTFQLAKPGGGDDDDDDGDGDGDGEEDDVTVVDLLTKLVNTTRAIATHLGVQDV